MGLTCNLTGAGARAWQEISFRHFYFFLFLESAKKIFPFLSISYDQPKKYFFLFLSGNIKKFPKFLFISQKERNEKFLKISFFFSGQDILIERILY